MPASNEDPVRSLNEMSVEELVNEVFREISLGPPSLDKNDYNRQDDYLRQLGGLTLYPWGSERLGPT